MRIIAGTLGGRIFDSPGGHKTHPMSDKIRGALFNMLGDIDRLTVLDAFAGTGALSFEAISRGAAAVVAIESDRIAQATITRNIQNLQLQKKVKLVCATALAWSNTYNGQPFDIVLLDPPYDNLQPNTVEQIIDLTAQSGIAVVSWPGGQHLPEFNGFACVHHKTYGDAQLGYYRRI
jgi:16S rRNA (guanine966-N2)-methyltransferase